MHGFCHIEIPAVDMAKASQFYSSLFGWPMIKAEGMDYILFGEQDGKVYGGISGVKKITSDPAACNYVEVEDVSSYLTKAEGLGAKTVRPRTELPGGMGFMAIFQDPQGYHMGLWGKS